MSGSRSNALLISSGVYRSALSKQFTAKTKGTSWRPTGSREIRAGQMSQVDGVAQRVEPAAED
ncbi:hypothetical protein AB0J47_02885 [Nocardia sp. NPDC049737]|uniref:hypothetical protein n=1 Tax=Nocardia sp. NPDC049737 TaxID=3154358 RepID=UPI00342009B1